MYMHLTGPESTMPRVATAPTWVFRTALRGAAHLAWRNRQVRLDEDAWLVLDARESCSVWLDPDLRTRLLVVVVPADELRAALAEPGGAREGQGGAAAPPPGGSAEAVLADNLRSRDGPAGRRLGAIARGREAGWSELEEREQRVALASEAWAEELDLRRKAARIDCVKPATREQLLRRILLASDFIASHHDEPISLDQMARAASLSRFHFVRLFGLVYGETPATFLRRKRTAVARRHLAVGSACSEAASRAGFGSRSSLFRNLRKSAPAVAGSESCFHSA